MIFIIAILFRATVGVECRTSEDASIFTPLPGTGYHYSVGSPLSESPYDLGKRTKPIFDVETYKFDHSDIYVEVGNSGVNCPQWSWKFPQGAWSYDKNDGVATINVGSATNSAKSYQEKSQTRISESLDGITPEGVQIAFTASQDFQHSSSTFVNEKIVEFRTTKEASSFDVSVDLGVATVLNSYWEDVLSAYGAKDFSMFFDTYGTHIVQRIISGARLEMKTQFKDRDYSELSSDMTQFETGLKVMYMNATAGIDSFTESQKSTGRYVSTKASYQKVICHGGWSDCDGKQANAEFWNNAYNYPAPVRTELYSHESFIAGTRRWEEFQTYVSDNHPGISLDLATFQSLWKQSINKLCEPNAYTPVGVDDICSLERRSFPDAVKVDWSNPQTSDFGQNYDALTIPDDRNMKDWLDAHNKDWIPESDLQKQADWFQITRINYSCYDDKPMSLSFTMGDFASPDLTWQTIGQNAFSDVCNHRNWCHEDEITVLDSYYYCGGVFGYSCDWCCAEWTESDQNPKIQSYSLSGDDRISELDIQWGSDTDGGEYYITGATVITRMMFTITHRDNTNTYVGCKGHNADSIHAPVHTPEGYRLLNYKGGADTSGRISSLAFRFYKLESADESESTLLQTDVQADTRWVRMKNHDGTCHTHHSEDCDDNEPRQFATPVSGVCDKGDVCCDGSDPIGIRCKTVGQGGPDVHYFAADVDSRMTGQITTCNLETGFSCSHHDNLSMGCYDYYVEYQCVGAGARRRLLTRAERF